MPVELELLAPAKNLEIGIAAIDCGADAVYIAGPVFGARAAAGNNIEDIHTLCKYAHKFGARIFITLNTILYDNELDNALKLIKQVITAGADALIIQDLGILQLINKHWPHNTFPIPLHASTQCSITNTDKAEFLEKLGFARLVLERELSIEQIASIKNATNCEIEFFVHGALCVCYSGQCYISEYISHRSANRGECMQACRSRYDLVDKDGNVIVKNKALLSLKDYNLLDNLEDLAKAGVNSFKIEGRLKNISYVKNVVREYSLALDRLVGKYPNLYHRASWGHVTKGFLPKLDKTFNRGYTSLFINGKRSFWASLDTPKGMGEYIGVVNSIKPIGREQMEVQIKPTNKNITISNGDGLAFYTNKDIIGFRVDVCRGLIIRAKFYKELNIGTKIFRNFSIDFENLLNTQNCIRELNVNVNIEIAHNVIVAKATSEDGRQVCATVKFNDYAQNLQRMEQMLYSQINKKTDIYNFNLDNLLYTNNLPFLSSKDINNIRRTLAEELNKLDCIKKPMYKGKVMPNIATIPYINYKYNIANGLAYNLFQHLGAKDIEQAFEIKQVKGAELMRSKYCIKYELGICPTYHKAKNSGPLFLINNGKRFALKFDCPKCEMIVMADE